MSEKARLTKCVYCEAPTIRQTGRCSACFRVEHFVQSNIALVLQVLDRLGIERLEWVPGPPVVDGEFLVRFTDGLVIVVETPFAPWSCWKEDAKEHAKLKPSAK